MSQNLLSQRHSYIPSIVSTCSNFNDFHPIHNKPRSEASQNMIYDTEAKVSTDQSHFNMRKTHQIQIEKIHSQRNLQTRQPSIITFQGRISLRKSIDDKNCSALKLQNNRLKPKKLFDFIKSSNTAPTLALHSRLEERILLNSLKSVRQVQKGSFQKEFLILDISELDSITMFNQQFLTLPCYVNTILKDQSKVFEEYCVLIRNRFPKFAKKLYIFLQNGTQVLQVGDIPIQDVILIISTKPTFLGLQDYKHKKIYQTIMQIQAELYKTQLHILAPQLSILNQNSQRSTQPLTSLSNLSRSAKENPTFRLSKLSERQDKRLKSLKYTLKQGQSIQNADQIQTQQKKFRQSLIKNDVRTCRSDLVSQSKMFNEELDQFNKDVQQYLANGTSEFVTKGQNLDRIIQYYNLMLKTHILRREPKNLQEYPTIGQNELVHRIGDDYIHERLQQILQNSLKDSLPIEDIRDDEEPFIRQPSTTTEKRPIPSKQGVLLNLAKVNRPLFLHNIPKLQSQSSLSRYQLHSFYILYKVLHVATAQKYRNNKQYHFEDGVDYETFRTGIYKIFVQSEELAKGIFQIIDKNFSGFLVKKYLIIQKQNWKEFLQLMSSIQASTTEEKINLFFKLADSDGNGSLSYEEVKKLCTISLKRFVLQDNNLFLDDVSDFFTQVIFKSVNINFEEEIPLDTIKSEIIQGNPDGNLLCMFCGVDI